MNTPNNKRRKESQNKIIKAFVNIIQEKELNEISVSEICKLAHLNRSTFYANYIDIYDLAEKVAYEIESEVVELYSEERTTKNNSHNYLKLFKHIKENQIFYNTYFKLNMDKLFIIKEYDTNLSKHLYNDQFIDYHIEFFMAGLNAIIKKWLQNGCQESPEEINAILEAEYNSKMPK